MTEMYYMDSAEQEHLRNLLNKLKAAEYLYDKGWSTWYNADYWVHENLVEDKTRQDYTQYGVSFIEAVLYQSLDSRFSED